MQQCASDGAHHHARAHDQCLQPAQRRTRARCGVNAASGLHLHHVYYRCYDWGVQSPHTCYDKEMCAAYSKAHECLNTILIQQFPVETCAAERVFMRQTLVQRLTLYPDGLCGLWSAWLLWLFWGGPSPCALPSPETIIAQAHHARGARAAQCRQGGEHSVAGQVAMHERGLHSLDRVFKAC